MAGQTFEETRASPRGPLEEPGDGLVLRQAQPFGPPPLRPALPASGGASLAAPAPPVQRGLRRLLEALPLAGIILALCLVVAAGVDRFLARHPGDAPASAAKGDRGLPLVADGASRRDRLDGLEAENARLREETQALSRRLAELERQVGPTTGSLDRPGEPAAEPSRGQAATGEPAPQAPPRDIGDGAAGAAAALGPSLAGTRGDANLPRFGLHLASFSDVASARQTWSFLRSQHGELLQNLAPGLAPGRDPLGNSVLRLLVGPFPTTAAAEAKCAELKTRQLFCALWANFKEAPAETLQ